MKLVSQLLIGICILSSAARAGSHVSGACTSEETWNPLPKLVGAESSEFQKFLSGKISVPQGFSSAWTMRRHFEHDPQQEALSHYWIGLSLFRTHQLDSAHRLFSELLESPSVPSGLRFAALGCLNQIRSLQPAWAFTQSSAEAAMSILSDAETPAEKEALARAASHLILRATEASAKKILSHLPEASAWSLLTRFRYAVRMGASDEALRTGQSLLVKPNLPPEIQKQWDATRLLLARILYANGKLEEAGRLQQNVSRSSNLLARAIEEQSWTRLQGERLGDTIGSAASLQAGGLRATFAPESLMVMAMAYNELCQYPQALQALKTLRMGYEKEASWLKDQKAAASSGGTPLYSAAIAALRGQPLNPPVPKRILSEWLRSPQLIQGQRAVNSAIDSEAFGKASLNQGGAEWLQQVRALAKRWQELQSKIRSERKSQPELKILSPSLRQELQAYRHALIQTQRFAASGPAWRAILEASRKQIPLIAQRNRSRIEADLSARNQRMLARLEEISENSQLIEIEIYQGASQDLVFKNAHPDFTASLPKKASQELGLYWGKAPGMDGEDGEIWEDELGSFRADLPDNCANQERFLALKPGE
jgi:hypothetical protein